ncbi:hypothetical protein BT96DRAFT_860948 [Gymnopus androsaceus JB14]|uniref:NadR/Ttd14 AAA domain-containing protein n=1 Tax=Gymnopus androsaceus JB14 TaxID=1447944 RepID=A0A6A4HF24_9AGAR|nr:hypothetical protein BT96DRAFT_860948 [Gymnopus androsaceus JB14]
MTETFTQPLKAIYIVGPSSTGKTTLCNALAAQLGLPFDMHITEVARTVMKEQGFTRADVHSLAMQHAIVKAQAARDLEARQKSVAEYSALGRPVLLSDRSAVDAVVYSALSELTAKSGNTKFLVSSPDFQNVLSFYSSSSSTFVLLRPIRDWLVDDGVRSLDDGEHCYDMFVKILKELGIRFIELGQDCRWLEERVAFIRRAVLV